MITQLFPIDFFIQIKPPNFEEILSKVNKIEVDDSEIQKENWGTNCIVKTISLDREEWRPILNPAIKQFCGQIGWNGSVQTDYPWVNFYKRNYFQEVHRHVNCDFATVLFLNSGEDFARFYFQNRMMGFIPPLIENLANIRDAWYPDIVPGDMLFFPAYTLHGVSPHLSEEVRKTLSFNITLSEHE